MRSKANTWTKYEVVHVYTGTEDGIASVTDVVDHEWETDTTVAAELQPMSWFVTPAEKTIYIKPDGTASTTYVYNRTWYELSYDTNGWTSVEPITVTYGALNPKDTGYRFVEWTWTERMPLEWTTLTAIWEANTWTKYTVNHLQQQLDETYLLIDTEVLYGTSNVVVTPDTITYTGFTSPDKQSINIEPDGSSELSYYYTRNSYNLVIKDRGEVLVDTGIKFGDIIILPDDPVWTWYEFKWWSNLPEDRKMPATWLEMLAMWNVNTYTITFDTDGWSEIAPITQEFGTPITKPANPGKYRYRFVSWDPEIPETMPAYDMTVKAVWEEYGRSGWWGRKSSWSDQEHGAADEESELYEKYPTVDPEVLSAYLWARKYGITTMDTFEEADPYGLLLRWHMAKMSVNYAVNVLWRQMPTEIPARCNWWDKESERESEEIKDYARKSCALWIMGIYMEDFLPNKEVSRAEFWTILSRLLWWSVYNVIDTNETPFYVKHLAALKKENIMTQIDRPLIRKELRERVWVMLRRASQLEGAE